jgi:hypothetical protein
MTRALIAAAGLALSTLAASGQPSEPIAAYFGFEEARFVKVDDECGPFIVADFNADGRPDLAIVNNRKSRVEMHYLRAAARPPEEQQKATRANELPPSPWYDREYVSVAHRVTALRAADVDGDGKLDLVYAGVQPSELVVMRQESPAKFALLGKTRVKDLGAREDGLYVADVIGDSAPEVVTISGTKIAALSVDSRGRFGEPRLLGSTDQVRGLEVADMNGDGLLDLLAAVPDDPAPVRLWVQSQDPTSTAKFGMLASEQRFEMPGIRDFETLRFRRRAAASVGVIERASQRVVFYDLAPEGAPVSADGAVATEREVQAEVTGFEDSGVKGRPVVAADLTGNGMPDLVTIDQKGNAVVVYRQQKGVGLASAASFPAFKTPKQVDVGNWFEGSTRPQVFVLSEEEKAVGVSLVEGDGRIAFPKAIAIKTAGATPTVMKLVPGAGGRPPALAVIVKDRRDYTLEVHTRSGNGGSGEFSSGVETLALKDVKRDPSAILPFDFDRDGTMDLLILTPGESMMMVHCTLSDGRVKPDALLSKDTMPQFGLVQAAGPDNTALLDVDADGSPELVIADGNYIRFAAYDAVKGWRVVDQMNVPDSSTQMVGVGLLEGGEGKTGEGSPPVIVGSDKANSRLLMFARNDAGRWALREKVRVAGFTPGPVRTGEFTGDGHRSVISYSDDAFAIVRLGGNRQGLTPIAAWRSESENRLSHTMACGDVNGDGYTDAVVLDARDQMCQILTFSASRKVMLATEFKVFESRLFERGDTRELQPSDALIAEATGDGAPDLLLLVHDRVIVYPQTTPGGDGAATGGGATSASERGKAARPAERPAKPEQSRRIGEE